MARDDESSVEMGIVETILTSLAQPLIERLTGKTRDERERTHALAALADAEMARAQSDTKLADATEHLAQAVERLTDPPAASHGQQSRGTPSVPRDDSSGPTSSGSPK